MWIFIYAKYSNLEIPVYKNTQVLLFPVNGLSKLSSHSFSLGHLSPRPSLKGETHSGVHLISSPKSLSSEHLQWCPLGSLSIELQFCGHYSSKYIRLGNNLLEESSFSSHIMVLWKGIKRLMRKWVSWSFRLQGQMCTLALSVGRKSVKGHFWEPIL